MADIFISYASEDRLKAEALAHGLKAQGWSVWWDRTIPVGRPFDKVIQEELDSARCVVVLWSEHSVNSEWVWAEAEEAAKRSILLPVLLDSSSTPLPFRRLQTADLSDWSGSVSNRAYQALVAGANVILGPRSDSALPTKALSTQVPSRRLGLAFLWVGATLTVSLSLLSGFQALNRTEALKSVTISSVSSSAMVTRSFRDCADCPEMVTIPTGKFIMGSPESEIGRHGDEDLHQVTIDYTFALGRYEVTRREFAEFAAITGHSAGGCRSRTGKPGERDKDRAWNDPGFSQTEDDPVVCISWNTAQDYARWLSNKVGHSYRLPSEAEWEYAARAGTSSSRFWGDNPSLACAFANVGDETGKAVFKNWVIHPCSDGHVYTAPVGQFRANDFGLYDMLGNVWEWVEDCNGHYSQAPLDGRAASSKNCATRVPRGGAWTNDPWIVRSAFRDGVASTSRFDNVGFRVARVLP